MPATERRSDDNLGALVGRGVTVAHLMHLVEARLDALDVALGEQFARNLDRDGVLLPDVAHVGRVLDDDIDRVRRGRLDVGAALLPPFP